MKTQNKLIVYYDGLCKVCSKEMSHYKSQKGADKIDFIDICSSAFKAEEQGLDPYEIHKNMHARTAEGTVVTRVDAFIEIWKCLPKYNFLASWATKSYVKPLLEKAYTGFTLIRPYLPRYKNSNDCKDSPYCEVNNA